MNLTFEGDDSLFWLCRLARDIITMARWMDVFACTLLHSELQDYSLGQIAFAVFQALFAITQLLFQVKGC